MKLMKETKSLIKDLIDISLKTSDRPIVNNRNTKSETRIALDDIISVVTEDAEQEKRIYLSKKNELIQKELNHKKDLENIELNKIQSQLLEEEILKNKNSINQNESIELFDLLSIPPMVVKLNNYTNFQGAIIASLFIISCFLPVFFTDSEEVKTSKIILPRQIEKKEIIVNKKPIEINYLGELNDLIYSDNLIEKPVVKVKNINKIKTKKVVLKKKNFDVDLSAH